MDNSYQNQKQTKQKSNKYKERLEIMEARKQEKLSSVKSQYTKFMVVSDKEGLSQQINEEQSTQFKTLLNELRDENNIKSQRLNTRIQGEVLINYETSLATQGNNTNMSMNQSIKLEKMNSTTLSLLNNNNVGVQQAAGLQADIIMYNQQNDAKMESIRLQLIQQKELNYQIEENLEDVKIMNERNREINQLMVNFNMQDKKLGQNITQFNLEERQSLTNNSHIGSFFNQEHNQRQLIIDKLASDSDKQKQYIEGLAIDLSNLQTRTKNKQERKQQQDVLIVQLEQSYQITQTKFNNLYNLVNMMEALTQIHKQFLQMEYKPTETIKIEGSIQTQQTLMNESKMSKCKLNAPIMPGSGVKKVNYSRNKHMNKSQVFDTKASMQQRPEWQQEIDIKQKLKDFQLLFPSISELEQNILSKFSNDSLLKISLQNMFNNLTEQKKQMNINLVDFDGQIVDRKQIYQTQSLQVDFYVFQDTHSRIEIVDESIQNKQEYAGSLEDALDQNQGYSLNLSSLQNDANAVIMIKQKAAIMENNDRCLRIYLFINELLSKFSKIVQKAYQVQDRNNMHVLKDEEEFNAQSNKWLHMCKDFQIMKNMIAPDSTPLNANDIKLVYLNKNYKSELQEENNESFLQVNLNSKTRSIFQKFSALFPGSEEEAQIFIESICQDQIMFALSDCQEFTNYMGHIHKYFINHCNLNNIQESHSKYFLLFLQANMPQFSNQYHKQFNEQCQFNFDQLKQLINQQVNVNKLKSEVDQLQLKKNISTPATIFFKKITNIIEDNEQTLLDSRDDSQKLKEIQSQYRRQHMSSQNDMTILEFDEKDEIPLLGYGEQQKLKLKMEKEKEDYEKSKINNYTFLSSLQNLNYLQYPEYWESYYNFGKKINEMNGDFITQDFQKRSNKSVGNMNKTCTYISNQREKNNFNNDLYITAKQKIAKSSRYLYNKSQSIQLEHITGNNYRQQKQLPAMRSIKDVKIELPEKKLTQSQKIEQKLLQKNQTEHQKKEQQAKIERIKKSQLHNYGQNELKHISKKQEIDQSIYDNQKNLRGYQQMKSENKQQQENLSNSIRSNKSNPYKREIELIQKKIGHIQKKQGTKLPTIYSKEPNNTEPMSLIDNST